MRPCYRAAPSAIAVALCALGASARAQQHATTSLVPARAAEPEVATSLFSRPSVSLSDQLPQISTFDRRRSGFFLHLHKAGGTSFCAGLAGVGLNPNLMSNCNLPKPTLFMLVSAFAVPSATRAAYEHAIEPRLQLYSYSDDTMLSTDVTP